MAEVLARNALLERGWDHVTVKSAGTSAYLGGGASGGALRAAAANGLDLAAHMSQPLSVDLVEWADLVLTMSPAHLDQVSDQGGAEKATLLGVFEPDVQDGVVPSIPDPFGGSDEQYLLTYERLASLVDEMLTRLPEIRP